MAGKQSVDMWRCRFARLQSCASRKTEAWSKPVLLADRPTKTPGWSICYPTLTELPDGTALAIWAQVKSTSTELYGDIHAARLKL